MTENNDLLSNTDHLDDAGSDNAGPPAKLHKAKSLPSRYQRLKSDVSDLQVLSAQTLAAEDFQATVCSCSIKISSSTQIFSMTSWLKMEIQIKKLRKMR